MTRLAADPLGPTSFGSHEALRVRRRASQRLVRRVLLRADELAGARGIALGGGPTFFGNTEDKMADDLTKKRPQDSSKINIHEPWEVRYWCSELKCTESQLIAAVKAVGTNVAAVRRHLGR